MIFNIKFWIKQNLWLSSFRYFVLCPSELASQKRENKCWMGLEFVHWEFMGSLLFANCCDCVTGCWRSCLITVSLKLVSAPTEIKMKLSWLWPTAWWAYFALSFYYINVQTRQSPLMQTVDEIIFCTNCYLYHKPNGMIPVCG